MARRLWQAAEAEGGGGVAVAGGGSGRARSDGFDNIHIIYCIPFGSPADPRSLDCRLLAVVRAA